MTQFLAPGLQTGTGNAMMQFLAPGLHTGTGSAEARMVDVANAAEAPATHIPRTRAFTAIFMTVVLLKPKLYGESLTVVETSSYTEDYIC
jgi:hypothetical protein